LLEGSQIDNPHCPTQLLELAQEAVEIDGARLIVLALPDYNDWADQVREHLVICGIQVLILDPVKVAIKHAENIVEMGMSQSKITFPTPEIRVYEGCPDF
jgi:allantoin racemase